jgi:hypothetical protein
MFPANKSRFNLWQMAATVLLLTSVGGNLWLFSKWQNTDERLVNLISERNQLAQENEQTLTRFNEVEEMMAHLAAPASREIELQGTDLSKQSSLRVVWNPESSRLLADGLDRLPAPPSGKQYQLWAIVEGKPVDAGTLDYQNKPQWGKSIPQRPAAFAVTLEPVGGSVNPTLDQMYVVGELG